VTLRLAIAVVLAALGAGALAVATSGDEPAPQKPHVAAAQKKSELPPLPELRPKVVEPVAGDAGGATEAAPDPGLEDAGPKPKAPASAGLKPQRAGHADITKATARPNGIALPPLEAPEAVKQIIEAGNIIARSPYKWGGGHGKWLDNGYDCSGSVSFALAGAGLLNRPLTSGLFMRYGDEGPGDWITIYANQGHVFMVVAGLRFDTSGQGRAGTRWQQAPRSVTGFAVRHIPGL
jgi:cell wall-associated NlpC family hydrolase